jgi:transposase-like protein
MLALLRDRPLESLQCPNSKCPSHKSDATSKGLSIRYWRGNDTIRHLHCHDCGLEFSERQGTPLFRLRIGEQKAFDVLNHVTGRLRSSRYLAALRGSRRDGNSPTTSLR